jgi:hypothetical protein
MDAIDFLLLRYGDLHRGLVDDLLGKLTEAQVRGRPHPGVNTVAWLLWHAARIEDVGVNRFVAERPQALDAGWLDRLKVGRRDVGTGMDDAEVDTLEVLDQARAMDLMAPVPAERVKRICAADGVVSDRAAWLTEPLTCVWAS